MKAGCFLIILCFATYFGRAQNYFTEYPITASVASNGQQFRIECSTYDAILQSNVYFNSPWLSDNIIISDNAFGKLGFTIWDVPTVQVPEVGFIIYDKELHQFKYQTIALDIDQNDYANVVCGRIWVSVISEYTNTPFNYYSANHYRYNSRYHNWISAKEEDLWVTSLWNHPPVGNSDWIYNYTEPTLYYYDPIINQVQEVGDCGDVIFDTIADYGYEMDWCDGGFNFFSYDAEWHQYAVFPRENLEGELHHGIFYAWDTNVDSSVFFFTYDQSVHQWKSDSLVSGMIENVIIKDRVVAYTDLVSGGITRVFYMAYNPLLHEWIKDSIDATGTVSNLTIQNGTVSWNDGGGSHIRGYNVSTGWGNFNTPLFLHFQLTDFTAQGHPVVHVRNTSIGTDNIYFDFGDGAVSFNQRQVLWHFYDTSGTYNICIYDSSGMQSDCQQVTMSICATASFISISSDTICDGDTAFLNLPSFTGSIQWQSKTGTLWVDETGPGATSPNYAVSPSSSITYRAKVTNGLCVPAFSNEQFIKVFEQVGNITVSDTLLTMCSNQWVRLYCLGANPGVIYQWQVDIGNGWVNTFNGDEEDYLASGSVDAFYRVIVSSGSCFADTSDVVTIFSDTLPSNPVTTGDQHCGPGVVNLQAVSNGTVLWYENSSQADSILHTGNQYSPFLNSTTTFRTRATSGYFSSTGYADNSIGPVDSLTNPPKGIRFYISSPCVLENFYIYPLQQGAVTIRLNRVATGELLKSKTVQAPGPGMLQVWMGSSLIGNSEYDLVISENSIPVAVNTGGISYPVSTPGNPLIILGYVDSVFHVTPDHYNFYNITVTTGCKTLNVNVTGWIYPLFNAATINPAGPLSFCAGGSVILNAFPSGGVSYSWLRNNTPVATGTSYTANTPGNYRVIISNGNCIDTSNAVRVTIPCIEQFQHEEKLEQMNTGGAIISMTYDPSSMEWIIHAELNADEIFNWYVFDLTGRKIQHRELSLSKGTNIYRIHVPLHAAGLYLARLQGNKKVITGKWFKYPE